MKHRKASMDHFEQRIMYYRTKTIQELQLIKPKWAFGENEGKMMDGSLRSSEKEYRIILVNLALLMRHAILFEVSMDTLFTGDSKNDWRIANILYRWDNGLHVDPPTVGIWDQDKSKLVFSDGRHRSKLSAFLNICQIPVAIHHEDIKIITDKFFKPC